MKHWVALLVLSIGFLGAAHPAGWAQAPEDMSSAAPFHTARLADKPRRWLQDATERGFSLHGLFVHDWSKSWNDPDDPARGFGRYSLDFSLGIEGEKTLGWKGATGFARLKQHIEEFGHGDDLAAQLCSNIDASSRTVLYELWLEQRLFDEGLRVKFGKIDANTEFAVVEGAGDFLNSSMGYSPTIVAFPSYPEPKLGVGIFARARKNYGVGVGLFRTAGPGTLSVIEPGRRWVTANDLAGHASVGYWRRDGDTPRFDGRMVSATQGIYAVFEQALWRTALPTTEGSRTLSAFLQLGQADGAVSPFAGHVGGGMVLQAPLRQRPNDSLGMAATWVQFSRSMLADFDGGAETIVETYYKVPFNRRIAFVADFQWLHHPGGTSSQPDCAVVTPRLVISF